MASRVAHCRLWAQKATYAARNCASASTHDRLALHLVSAFGCLRECSGHLRLLDPLPTLYYFAIA